VASHGITRADMAAVNLPRRRVVNRLMVALGWPKPGPSWLGDPTLAMVSIIIINTWRGLPFYGITLLAGLQTVPSELYEAASIDGVSWWSRFRYVTLPMLSPVVFLNLIIGLINSMQSGFTITFLFSSAGFNQTGAGPDNSLLLLVLSKVHTITKNGLTMAYAGPRGTRGAPSGSVAPVMSGRPPAIASGCASAASPPGLRRGSSGAALRRR